MRGKPEIFGLVFFTDMEIFKDIPNYEGIYQVSNFGNVKSLSRTIKNNDGFYLSKEIKLKSAKSKNNYFSVVLRKDKVSKTFRVHVLVAMAFLDFKPNYFEYVIDHKNGVRADNRLENLQVVTQRINVLKDKKRTVSNFAGVKKNKKLNKWTSQMKINKKFIHLGVFENEEDAGKMYVKAVENIDNYLNPKQFRNFLK